MTDAVAHSVHTFAFDLKFVRETEAERLARAATQSLAARPRGRRLRALGAQPQPNRTARRPATGAPRLVSPWLFYARLPGTVARSRGGYGPAWTVTRRLREYERGFRRAGLPLFIAERSAATDIFNRAVPLIGFVFLVEVLGALNLEWSPLANVAAVVAALAAILGGHRRSQPLRADGPPVAIPEDVGPVGARGVRDRSGDPAADLRRAVAERARDGGRQPGPPRPDLRRRGARPRLDPALDPGPPRRPASRLVRALRARGARC